MKACSCATFTASTTSTGTPGRAASSRTSVQVTSARARKSEAFFCVAAESALAFSPSMRALRSRPTPSRANHASSLISINSAVSASAIRTFSPTTFDIRSSRSIRSVMAALKSFATFDRRLLKGTGSAASTSFRIATSLSILLCSPAKISGFAPTQSITAHCWRTATSAGWDFLRSVPVIAMKLAEAGSSASSVVRVGPRSVRRF